MINQKQQLEKLFDRWKRKPNHVADFIEDGIVNQTEWSKQKLKVLFFLKEAYGGPFDLAKTLDNEGADFGRSQIWSRAAVWTQAVYDSTKPPRQYDEPQGTRADNLIRSIAVINIKKSHGQNKSDDADLMKFLVADKAELTEELSIINPDVILCGNILHLLQAVNMFPGARKGKSDDYFWNGKLIINYWHPSGRDLVSNNEINYYAIREICRVAHDAFKITAW